MRSVHISLFTHCENLSRDREIFVNLIKFSNKRNYYQTNKLNKLLTINKKIVNRWTLLKLFIFAESSIFEFDKVLNTSLMVAATAKKKAILNSSKSIDYVYTVHQ